MRIKRGKLRTKKRKKLLKETKGFKWGRKNLFKRAKEAWMKAQSYAYRDRRRRKRDFRRLWNIQINAACRQEGISYSRFINGLKRAGIALNRKMLAQIAQEEPAVFKQIVKKAINAPKKPDS